MRRVGHGSRAVGRTAVAVVAVLGALGAGLGGVPAGAHTAEEAEKEHIQEQIESVQAQVTEASAEEARLLAEIDESAARKAELDARVAELAGQVHGLEHSLDHAQQRLTAVETELAAAEDRLSVAQTELADSRDRLVEYAIDAYTGRREANNLVGSLLRSQDMSELVAKRSYVKVVGESQTELIADRERLRDEVDDLTERLEAAQEEAAARRDQVDAERAAVQVKFDEQAAARAAVAQEIATTESLRGEVVARKAEFEAEIGELQRRSEEITQLLRQRAAEAAAQAGPAFTPAAASPGGGGLLYPIPGARVSSPFGLRVHPIYGDARMHTGVDISAGSGTPIRSAGDGVVVRAGPLGGYGNATIVDHGGGVATLYAHQSSIGVSSGQRVSGGQVIGRVGCTGACTGPHLHFEVRLNGSPVNPMPYIT